MKCQHGRVLAIEYHMGVFVLYSHVSIKDKQVVAIFGTLTSTWQCIKVMRWLEFSFGNIFFDMFNLKNSLVAIFGA